MARPRTFDEAMVLAKARDHFWTHGYSATSIQGLESVTGLNRSSLYQAFGDKRQLFLQILDHYQSSYQDQMKSLVAQSSSFTQIAEQLLGAVISNCISGIYPKGCLLINTATELGASDPEIKAFVKQNRIGFVDIVMPLALRDKSLALSPLDACNHLFASLAGMHALSQTDIHVDELRSYAKAALSALSNPN